MRNALNWTILHFVQNYFGLFCVTCRDNRLTVPNKKYYIINTVKEVSFKLLQGSSARKILIKTNSICQVVKLFSAFTKRSTFIMRSTCGCHRLKACNTEEDMEHKSITEQEKQTHSPSSLENLQEPSLHNNFNNQLF